MTVAAKGGRKTFRAVTEQSKLHLNKSCVAEEDRSLKGGRETQDIDGNLLSAHVIVSSCTKDIPSWEGTLQGRKNHVVVVGDSVIMHIDI